MSGAALVQCSFYGNAAPYGGNISTDCGGNITASHCIVASSADGVGLYVDGSSSAHIECTDIHGNAGGDWVGYIEVLLGKDGNICEDPLFCDPEGDDFTLAAGSPCLSGFNPDCGLMGAHGLGCDAPSAVPPPGILTGGARLYPNFPNPFNPATAISYEVPTAQQTRLSIYRVDGRRVVTLVDRLSAPGRQEVVWYGTDEHGRQVPSGIYFYRLEVGTYSETKRMALIK